MRSSASPCHRRPQQSRRTAVLWAPGNETTDGEVERCRLDERLVVTLGGQRSGRAGISQRASRAVSGRSAVVRCGLDQMGGEVVSSVDCGFVWGFSLPSMAEICTPLDEECAEVNGEWLAGLGCTVGFDVDCVVEERHPVRSGVLDVYASVEESLQLTEVFAFDGVMGWA